MSAGSLSRSVLDRMRWKGERTKEGIKSIKAHGYVPWISKVAWIVGKIFNLWLSDIS